MYVLTAQVAQTLYESSLEFTGECIKLLKYDLNYIKKKSIKMISSCSYNKK